MRMYSLTINDNNYEVIIKEVTEKEVKAEVNGVEHIVAINKISNLAVPETSRETVQVQPAAASPFVPQGPPAGGTASTGGEGAICSPIPGHILEIFVEEGDKVLVGQKLLVLEAMKLENIITADRAGVVKKILVSNGDSVNHDQTLVIIA